MAARKPPRQDTPDEIKTRAACQTESAGDPRLLVICPASGLLQCSPGSGSVVAAKTLLVGVLKLTRLRS